MDIVKELFGTEDLYSILAIAKDKVSDEKALRSAYMKAAIKYHPDKQEEKDREDATKKFQIVQKIYELFKDSELRKIYDQTGTWPDDDKIELDVTSLGRLDATTILEFKKYYQGSDEEREDIKKYYIKGKGDIFHICDNVFFLNVLDDEERVNSIIVSMIEKGELESLDAGKKDSKIRDRKLKKAQKEAEEAEKMMKEKNLSGSMEDLAKAIAKRNQARGGDFLKNLEAKYAAAENSKKSGKKKTEAAAEEGPSKKKAKSETASNNGSGGRTTRSRSAK